MQHSAFPAVISEHTTFTYAQVHALTLSFAAAMQRSGVRQDSIVALNTRNTVVSLAMLLATSALGCGFVVASKVLAQQKVVRPTHFFKTEDAAGKEGLGFVNIDSSWMPGPGHDTPSNPRGFDSYANPNQAWLFEHTTGSSGHAKTVALSQATVFRRMRAAIGNSPSAQVTMATLFQNTSAIFHARALATFLNAGTVVDSFDPDFWTGVGVNLVVGSPRLLAPLVAETKHIAKIAKVEVTGGPLSDEFARKLAPVFESIDDVYESAEAGTVFRTTVSVQPDGMVIRTGCPTASVIEIRTTRGDLCAAGKAGTLRISNGHLVEGYFNLPKPTAACFKDNWFYPGDLAKIGQRGELLITGRTDEVLAFPGFDLDAVIVEWIIKSTPGVRDAVCFKNPRDDSRHELVGYVVFEDAANQFECIGKIRASYEEKLRLPCFLGPIHAINAIPYNDEGKPMRALCQQILLNRVNESASGATA